jgi:outer membrane receptor protein involved in Fe transport
VPIVRPRPIATLYAFALISVFASTAHADDPEDVEVTASRAAPGLETRATSIVRKAEADERVPRSAPDALKYEPGVFVQQTSHGQGSPFIRGLFGSRVLLSYDGVRMNNATFRQGPNQYFFTLDSQAIDSITVVRGGASTLFGTDALGGALLVSPIAPRFAATTFEWHALARTQHHQADGLFGARASATVANERWAASLGAGITDAGLLRAGGEVSNLSDGKRAEVPRFRRDSAVQLGTGYRVFAADGMLRYKWSDRVTLVAAANVFRQTDTPRTDLCPPPFGVLGDCLTIKEQYRTLAYVGLDGNLGAWAKKARLRVSYQRQHEFAQRERPLAFVQNGGIDNVSTLGASGAFESKRITIGKRAWADIFWGADAYLDLVESNQWVQFTDTGRARAYDRGQYLDGSSYHTLGAYVRGELNATRAITAVLGLRGAHTQANLAEDRELARPARSLSFPGTGAEARLLVRPADKVEVSFGFDQSFRAPNLSDLSQRQQTGPGYQIDNPNLRAEVQWSAEAGLAIKGERVRFDGWLFRSAIDGYLTLAPRGIADCPNDASRSACSASWSRYELINVGGMSTIQGAEGALRVRLLDSLRLQATVTALRGEGPNPGGPGGTIAVGTKGIASSRVPLSRIPPVNGTVEARWTLPRGIYAGMGFRWALDQTRLALNDLTDYRIPVGGTPGFAVLDLRMGARIADRLVFNAQLENLFNTGYRTHGSGVNAPGRGFGFSLQGSL